MGDLGERMGLVSTYFLAAFAMLYVVGECLPKTDFMTRIDWVVMSTTGSIYAVGVAMTVLKFMSNTAEEDVVDWWNNACAVAIISVYTIVNVLILGGAILHQYRIVKGISTRNDLSRTVPDGSNFARLGPRRSTGDKAYRIS